MEQVYGGTSPYDPVDLLQTLATARLLIQAICELHHEEQWLDGTAEPGRGVMLMEPHCVACLRPYPCPTIMLIDKTEF